ncbi:MAG: hypothetical protein H6651_21180 [Ardenticatenales bacterium]|nr:hypothetical protein [Ardenticatenales bacterium]
MAVYALMLVAAALLNWLLAGLLDAAISFHHTLVCGVIAYRMASKLKPLNKP